jgi:hypothetical protein
VTFAAAFEAASFDTAAVEGAARIVVGDTLVLAPPPPRLR